jgi:hypothetical protein
MTLGAETIPLLPLKSWDQLDVHKWGARGKLPASPAGLEIALDHVKVAGETVSISDPDGCEKLEKLFSDWLALEKATQELAIHKPRPASGSVVPTASPRPEQQPLHYQVELDKRGQVHLHCFQGKTVTTSVGLSVPGINSLCSQGLMRQPHAVQVGVLRDWVELDGVLCSFEKGQNDAVKLERLLNERFIPAASIGQGKEIIVFANAASATGFDIQFPVSVGGVLDLHRYHLNDESLDRLHDPQHCGLLVEGLIIKLIPPTLVFKQKTSDGGERYLEPDGKHVISVTNDEGLLRMIDLSQPVNYLRLGPAELTAVFNHQAVNRHTQLAPPASRPNGGQNAPGSAQPSPPPQPSVTAAQASASASVDALTVSKPTQETTEQAVEATKTPAGHCVDGPKARPPTVEPRPKPKPNAWLQEVLAQPPIRHDWFGCLVYSKLAERFSNSHEGKFGPSACWFIALAECEDIADPAFKGIFLTEKGGLGFLNQDHLARCYRGVIFIGTQSFAIEGINVSLVGVGLDEQQRVVFVVTDGFRAKFGLPPQTVAKELEGLKEHGAVVLSVGEVLVSPETIEVLWTVPAEQANPDDPQAVESTCPLPSG